MLVGAFIAMNSRVQAGDLVLESPAAILRAVSLPRREFEAGEVAPLRAAALRCAVLLRFGKLLPEGKEQEALAALAGDSPAAAEQAVVWASGLPDADGLTFDGRRYVGENFGYIDNLIGAGGRPVALDREPPFRLVALSPKATVALVKRQAGFQLDPAGAPAREAADRQFGKGASADLFADGQYVRAYCGRWDDLYFHLFQKGDGPMAMAFCGLADGLGERGYHPLKGISKAAEAPISRFDLGDILSSGGRAAVRAHYAKTLPGSGRAFSAFAFRVMPLIAPRLHAIAVGGRITVSDAEMGAAFRSRHHLYPVHVPPLYPSAERFLGWAGARMMFAAQVPVLPPGAADAWYPLPTRDEDSAAGKGADSARLFEAPSSSELPWEDPAVANLLSDPGTEPPPRRPGEPAPDATSGAPESDPRLRPSERKLLAVVAPAAVEAGAYLAAIQDNDDRLRSGERLRGRIRESRRQLTTALGVLRAAARAEPLRQMVTRDLATLDAREKECDDERLAALVARHAIRTTLEERLQRERVGPLEALGGSEKAEATPPGGSPDL